MEIARPILAFDTASPVVSLAIAHEGELLASATLELRRSSEQLLSALEMTLEEAGLSLHDLGGAVALAGPGSFTGLRIGLATVLGFHQSLGLPATALGTLPILAVAAAEGDGFQASEQVVTIVDSLRGDWTAQPFRMVRDTDLSWSAKPLAEPALYPVAALATLGPPRLIGMGVAELARQDPLAGLEVVEAPPLAPVAARWVSQREIARAINWDPGLLTQPIYFRPPAVTRPS